MANEWIVVRIKRRIAYLISSILRGASVEPHYQATKATDPDMITKLRQEGDDLHQAAKDIENALHPGSSDDRG